MTPLKTMKMKHLVLLLLMATVFTGCNSGESDSKKRETASNKTLAKPNCFQNKFTNYGQMLSMEDIQKHYSIDPAQVKAKIANGLAPHENCFYLWPSNRPELSTDLSPHIKKPDQNQIGIAGLSAYDKEIGQKDILEQFNFAYKKLDEKDIEAIDKNIKKEMAGKSDEDKKNVAGLMKVREGLGFEKIENIGTSAYWRFSEKNGGELVTLVGNEKFSIYVKISHAPEENLELAKKLVATVIAKCS